MPLVMSEIQFCRLNMCIQSFLGPGEFYLKSLLDRQVIMIGLREDLSDKLYKLLFVLQQQVMFGIGSRALTEHLRVKAILDPIRWLEFSGYHEECCVADLFTLSTLGLIRLPTQALFPVVYPSHFLSATSMPAKVENEQQLTVAPLSKKEDETLLDKRKLAEDVQEEPLAEVVRKKAKLDEQMTSTQLELKVAKEKTKNLELRVKKLEAQVKKLSKVQKNNATHPEIMTLAILKALGWNPDDELLSLRVQPPSTSSSAAPSPSFNEAEPPILIKSLPEKALKAQTLSPSHDFLTFSPLSQGQAKEGSFDRDWLLTDHETEEESPFVSGASATSKTFS